MKKLLKSKVLGLSLIFLLGGFSSLSSAFEVEKGNREITINRKIEGDLIVVGKGVRIEEDIGGDLIALSTEMVVIKGDIKDDANIFGKTILTEGVIGNDLRVGGLTIRVKNRVDDGVFAFGEDITFDEDSEIGGDVVAWGERIEIGGRINGDARIYSESLILSDSAIIEGDLYYDVQEANIKSGAIVKGEISKRERVKKEVKKGFRFPWLKIILLWPTLLLIAILSSLLYPKLISEAAKTSWSWKALGIGFMYLIAVPVIILMLTITILGLPLALILLLFYLISLYVAKIFFGIFLGMQIIKGFKRDNLILATVVGVLVLMLILSIPIVGEIVGLFATLLGLGAMVLAKKDVYLKMKER